MGQKNDKSEFRAALLRYTELYETERQAQLELYAAQEKQQASYAQISAQRERVLALWAKVKETPCPGGYVLLPDGRLASIDTGSITVWKPMTL